MKYESTAILLALGGLASAGPVPQQAVKARDIKVREVPQEHSHNIWLDSVRTSLATSNPKGIVDPVFGLLGNAAAAAGAGTVTNLDCLQQETADQAFTNAKAAGDIPAMVGAMMYRAIERNTGGVGTASVICNETAVNPEIAALTQHQDPASTGAAATNKGIVLALAKELAGIGADPLIALESGTFAPGTIGDTTGAGNTCDTEADEPGCIYSQKLLVLDATEEEISSAVAGVAQTFTGTGVISATLIDLAGQAVATGASSVATSAAAVDTTTADAAATDACTQSTITVTASAGAAASSTCSVITTTVAADVAASMLATLTSTAAVATSTVASGTNVQKFTGTLGGAAPPVVSSATDRPFSVNGNTFLNVQAAIQRSCDIQHNACANAANSGALSGGTGQCETQQAACVAANSAAKKRSTKKRALDFGTCGNPTILFEAGLDGRNTNAFIAEDQTDFNHGSALNIAVIAGFICQRLGSPCSAAADVIASCTSASAAAVATTQDQSAADVFNNALGVGSGAAAAVTTAAAAAATTAAAAVAMTITQCA